MVGSCIGQARLAENATGSLGGLPNNMFRTLSLDSLSLNSFWPLRYATSPDKCQHPVTAEQAKDLGPPVETGEIFKTCASWTDVPQAVLQDPTPAEECAEDICPVGSSIFLYTKNYMTWHAKPTIHKQRATDEGTGTRQCSEHGSFGKLHIDWGNSLKNGRGDMKAREVRAQRDELQADAQCGCVPNAHVCAGPVFEDPEPHMAEFCECPGGKVIFGNPNGFTNPYSVPADATGVACTIAMFGNPVVGTDTKYGAYSATGQWKYCFCESPGAPPARHVPTFSAVPDAFEFRPEVNQCR